MASNIAVNRLHPLPGVAVRRPGLTDLPVVAGILAVSIGALVLIGLGSSVSFLTTLVPETVPMKANAAVGLVLIGTALVLLGRPGTSTASRRVGVGLALSVAAIGGLTSLEYLTGTSLGIDQLLFAAPDVGGPPDRMAPMTALSLLLLGSAVAASAEGIGPRWVVATAATAILVAILNLFMFAFAAASPSFLSTQPAMAAHTAIALTVVGLGVVGLLGPASPFVPLAGSLPMAVVSRRVLGVSIVSPVVLAWLRLQGQRLDLYDTEFGTSVVLVATMAIILIAILRSVRWATDLDARRVRAEIERDSFFEMSLDMLVVTGRDGVIQRVNRAWTRTFGYPAVEVQGHPWSDFIHPDDRERTIAQTERNLVDGEDVVGFTNRYRCADGTYRWLEWMSNVGADGSVAYGVARDVTARHAAEVTQASQTRVLRARNEDLAEQVTLDPLTGLHNRRFFKGSVARLERSWRRQSIAQRPQVAVILFDLDHFGLVNKQHGHQVGDQVLRAFGSILRDRFRANDLVVRFGGEEFVAVLVGAAAPDAVRIAESVRTTLEATAIDSPSGPLRVTVSAGVAQLGDERQISAGLALADLA
jgi:diguanylate cyclase (GGDEF)-like protein/PAS domain S-box-containing protein